MALLFFYLRTFLRDLTFAAKVISLEEAGFSRIQAEAQLQIIGEIVEGDLATKQDLKIAETGLKQDLKMLETNLENKLQQLEYRMTIKLGTLLVLCFTTMTTLLRFWLVR